MDIAKILTRKYPGAIWTLNANDYEQLDWLSDTPKPTKEELNALVDIVENEIQEEIEFKNTTRQSALAKLAAIGLTPEEIEAL